MINRISILCSLSDHDERTLIKVDPEFHFAFSLSRSVADAGYTSEGGHLGAQVYEVYASSNKCVGSYCEADTVAFFNTPTSVAVDGSGNLYVADTGNSAVKEIPPGCVTSSCVTTLSSSFTGPFGVAVDSAGDVYLSDQGSNAVKELMATGGYATVNTVGSGFGNPQGIALDMGGNIYVADAGANKVFELDCADAPSVTFPTLTAVDRTTTPPLARCNCKSTPPHPKLPGPGRRPSPTAPRSAAPNWTPPRRCPATLCILLLRARC